METKQWYTQQQVEESGIAILSYIPFPSEGRCIVHYDICKELGTLHKYISRVISIKANMKVNLFLCSKSIILFYTIITKLLKWVFWMDSDIEEILEFDPDEFDTLQCVGFTVIDRFEELECIRPLYDVRPLNKYQAYQLTNIFSPKE